MAINEEGVKHMAKVTQKPMARFSVIVSVLAVIFLFGGSALASSKGEPLTGKELKSFISGKRVFLKVPLGGELPLTYRPGGVVDGSGEAVGLGRFARPNDSGRWWVSGNQICQKWREWYKGRTFCFTVSKLSNNRIYWRRDDGTEGTSRVVRY